MKPKMTKSVRFKSPAKRKKGLANQKSANTSPNKLITEMFSSSKSNDVKSDEILEEKVLPTTIEDDQLTLAEDETGLQQFTCTLQVTGTTSLLKINPTFHKS